MSTATRFILLLAWIIIFTLLLAHQFGSLPLIPSIFYLWILLGWVFFTKVYRKKLGFSAAVAFVLFIIAALLTTVGLGRIAEIFMRVSFTLWILVLIQSLIEYKRS